jgi:serine/threonine protein kinase
LGSARAALADLKRELLITRKLSHPNIIDVQTFWRSGIHQFISMEYVEGDTLSTALSGRNRPFTIREVLGWFKEISLALDYAHSKGILHRDIKPANILLDKDSHVRVADFGLGSSIWEANKEDGEDSPIPQGTLLYISPEQLAGDSLNERSDQYSLASTIYELVSGAPPFHSGEVAAQIQIKSAPAIEYLSKTVNQSLLRALSKSQLKRFSSCMDFYQAIAEAVGESPDQGAGAAARIIDDQNRDTIVLNKASFQTRKTRLGRLLIDSGVISQLQLMDALIYQNKEEVKLGQALIELEFVTPNQIIEILSEQLQIPMVTLKDEAIDTGIANTIGKQTATLYHCIPLRKTAYGVLVAVADPLDMEMLNFLEEAFWNDIELRVAAESEIDAMVEEVYP